MSVVTHFTPLLGALDDGPLCYLLEIDDCRVLLDCGWDDSFSIEQLAPLEREIKKGLHAVILSHLDLAHIGALPYAVGKLGLNAPIYATAPIRKFGKLMFYDMHTSKTMEQDFNIFSMEDVDAAFELFIELRYDQPVSLEPFDIEMTPHCAGHLIGGSFWKIKKETDKIIYAVDYNLAKERHLNPSKLTMIERPTLMITDAHNVTRRTEKRKQRDIDLLKSIESTIRKSGDVLIPVDTAGRVLELLLLLDQEWSKFKDLKNANITFLSHTSYSTQDFAKSNLEWMNLKLDMGDNPYEFRHITTSSNLDEVNDLLPPRVVLASVPSLECGFARSLFSTWAQNANNLIIFTDRQRDNCLASQLLREYEKKRKFKMTFDHRHRVPLEGEELEAFMKQAEEEKQAQKDQEPEEEIHMEDEEEPEEIIPLLPTSYFEQSFDLIIENMDSSLRISHPMFPFQEETKEWDAYGEHVDWELVKQKTGEGDVLMNDNDDEDDTLLETEEEDIIPTKPIVETIELNVCCQMKFIDFEGRSDGMSMKNLLSLISPAKVILIHGVKEACDELSVHCANTDGCRKTTFMAPSLGERMDVTSGTVIFKLKLSESLTNAQRYSVVDGYNVAYINGKVSYRPVAKQETTKGDNENSEDEDETMTDGNKEEEEEEMEPYLIDIADTEIPGHDAVIMGSMRMVDLRDALIKKDFSVVLSQGVLLCNNLVTIQKSKGASHFQVDGPLCDEYFHIRDLLYQQFSVL